MRAGEFGRAWEVSDEVLRRHAGAPSWHLPRHQQWIWDGRSLEGKRVLVRCYHGLGDTIQFIRFVPRLRAIAREVIVWAQPSLIPLLEGLPGIDRLLPLHDGVPDVEYDADIEIMELAHYFRVTPREVGCPVPYLQVEPARIARGPGLDVGIVWAAGGWDPDRSMSFAEVEPLGGAAGITMHVLQRGPALAEVPGGWGIASGSDDLHEAARVVKALDLVITVDSMPAHLAGALGVPVWVLLKHDADWRWMTGTERSPWYPSMRLVREEREGEWEGVIARVKSALAGLSR